MASSHRPWKAVNAERGGGGAQRRDRGGGAVRAREKIEREWVGPGESRGTAATAGPEAMKGVGEVGGDGTGGGSWGGRPPEGKL
jgi:hypothetical protein